jgi:hypothetical protein
MLGYSTPYGQEASLGPRTRITRAVALLWGFWFVSGCCPYPCWSGPAEAKLSILLEEDSCDVDLRGAAIHVEGEAIEDGLYSHPISAMTDLEDEGDQFEAGWLPIYTTQHNPCDLALQAVISLRDRWGDEIAPDRCPGFEILAQTTEEYFWDSGELEKNFEADRKWDGLTVVLFIPYGPYCHLP